MNIQPILTVMLLCCLTVTQLSAQSADGAARDGLYQVILEVNRKGEVTKGNIAQLIAYVQQGNPVRVGWQLNFQNPDSTKQEIISLYHWTDAGFITVLQGEVFAQISSIYEQGPSTGDIPAIFMTKEGDLTDEWLSSVRLVR